MKKVTVIITAIALTLGMAQCRKHVETIAQPAGGTVDVTVRVENGSDKTDITATGVVTWKQGDKIYIVGETQGLLGYVSALSAGDPVNFAGSITAISSAQTLKFYYVGDKTFTLDGSGNYTFGISGQDGSLAGIAAYNQMMFGKTTGTVPAGTTDLGTINMNSVMAIAHLNINDGGSAVSGPVTVTGGFASATFNAKTYAGETLSGTAGYITMTFATGTTSTNCYIALLPGAQTLTFMDAGGKMARFSEKTIAVNGFYNSGSAIEVTVKPIEFTVDADGTKVKFAPGNLQYLGQAEEGHKWRFAEHQWDYMGDGPNTTTGKKGNVDLGADYAGKYNTGSGEAGGSETEADSVAARDLFGWGATGYQDTRAHTYQKNYRPYSTSTANVQTTYNCYGYGPDYDGTNKYGLSVDHNSDWGCVTGLPSAGEGKSWRTLTKDEWEYLLNTRTDVNRFAKAVVNGVKGLLIFPDGYTGTVSGDGIATVNTTDVAYPSASIPETTWPLMEFSGVVFLPAAGSRGGTDIINWGGIGNYWSSSCQNSILAYLMNFNSGNVNPQTRNNRYVAFSVRLVR